MEDLRAQLLADPYFRGVPSMQPEARKTALYFHAKDDVPEVRREVFKVLKRHTLHFHAVVRDKRAVADYVQQRNEREAAYRYNPNELYDYLVKYLFRYRLHRREANQIYFARRGKSDRTAALRLALRMGQRSFTNKHFDPVEGNVTITACSPVDRKELQAVDYFLWGLQRLFERQEDRYVELLWPAFRLVRDLDDKREGKHGVCYTQERPLSLAAFQNKPGI